MHADLIIAILFAASAGTLAWLFFQWMYDKVAHYKEVFAEVTTSKFSELFLFVDVSRYFHLYLTMVVLLPIIIGELSGDVLLAVPAFIVLVLSPYIILRVLLARRLKQFERQLPDGLLMLSGSLRAGASLAIALDNLIKESCPPLSQEFSLLVRERKLGVDLDAALEHMERRLALEDLTMALSAIRISREVGGDLAATLETLAETLRRKLTMEGKIDSLTSQGRLQGFVMSALPLVLMGVLLKLEPDSMRLMFTTRIGWAFLVVILCMQVLGFLAIRKITRIEV